MGMEIELKTAGDSAQNRSRMVDKAAESRTFLVILDILTYFVYVLNLSFILYM
jgi:hypothetical protein